MLMKAKGFAEQPAGTRANRGLSQLLARNNAEPGRRAGREWEPVHHEATSCRTLTSVSNRREFPCLSEAPGAWESQAERPFVRHARGRLDGSKALAANPAAVGQNSSYALR